MSRANPAAAFAAGLTPRPLRETVADIRAEDRAPGHWPARRRHLGRARGGTARPLDRRVALTERDHSLARLDRRRRRKQRAGHRAPCDGARRPARMPT